MHQAETIEPKHSSPETFCNEDLKAVGTTRPFRYSVVTAAYNAAPWINALLDSLTRQTIGFREHIQVVVVDDGSTDATAKMVGRWVERYPENITLICQNNGGPSSARNRGLDEVSGDWISFIDADDIVAPAYFKEVEDFLLRSAFAGPLIACNLLFFYEPGGQVVDGHGLGYKFRETRVVDLLEQPEYIQLSSSSCLLKRTFLERSGLRFDTRIKPTFEDAHFLSLFLLHARDFQVAFVREAHYLYRRRGGGTGLVEGGWAKPEKYRDQILFGYLDLAQQYQRVLGNVPAFVQNLILYEAHWYMERLLQPTFPCALTKAQQDEFFSLEALVFRHVDARQILLSKLPALELRTRIAMLGAFKGVSFTALPFIVAEVAPGATEARLVHWSTDKAAYKLNGPEGDLPTAWEKHAELRFGDRILCHEASFWVPLHDDPVQPLADKQAPGTLCRDTMLDTLKRQSVRTAFYLPPEQLPEPQRARLKTAFAPEGEQYRGGWVLMDRTDKADDNAEHFCRWLLEHHPEQPVHFVLDSRSQDWHRLQREGFPLLTYGSDAHFQALAQAQWLISSHVDKEVTDPMQTWEHFGTPAYKTAFLQHGIIKEDLSRWLNQYTMNCFVTSTRPEFESVRSGSYKFTEREVVLAGLPRHDALLRKARTRKASRIILLCPTWRENLMRTGMFGLSTAETQQRFAASDFFRAWEAVTASRSLARLVGKLGYRLVFLPHPETEPFLPLFRMSEHCSAMRWKDVKSVQDLLVAGAIMVTDYSSLVFDAAYIGRPVAYYQFPETPSYYASQARRKDYFTYPTHGLGPIVPTVSALEDWLDETLRGGGQRQLLYEERAEAFFTLRDGRNCERVWDAILARS